MVKAKKKNISDVKLVKPLSKKQNPFEVHVNRAKFNVLGQKSKFDKGLPGVARAKAIKKRKETLLQEYKVQDKTNKFIDRRIGERTKGMTAEDRIIARFTAERMKAHKKKTMFNLADEEVLTHKGRSITEVERFDDPRSDDEDDNVGNTGQLNADFVEEAHFGGGMFTKSKNSRESVIDQLIADSKRRKLERQQTKEKTLELTEKLDSEWKDLVPMINSGHVRDKDEEEVPNKGRGDPFDIALKELKFEARGKPTDKLKSEEEIAEMEAKRLRDLEEERLRRMRGEDTEVTVVKRQHRSADDLDDGFQLDDNEEFSVMYDKDGNLIRPQKDVPDMEPTEDKVAQVSTNPPSDSSDDDKGDEEDEEEEEEEEDDDDVDYLKGEIEAVNQLEDSDDEERSSESDTEDAKNKRDVQIGDPVPTSLDQSKPSSKETIKADGLSDIKNMAAKKRDSKEVQSEADKASVKKKRVCFGDEVEEVRYGEEASLAPPSQGSGSFKEDLLRRKQLMDQARSQLPFTFPAPKCYGDLEELLKGRKVEEVAVIVERIISCHHPRLRAENMEHMTSLLAFLMQHINDLDNQECWKSLDRLAPHLYDLAKFSPSSSAECLAEIIKEKQAEYSEKKSKFPPHSTLAFLKLVPLLFPASDKRHPVTTPAMVFMTQILQNSKVTNRRSIASGLFLVTIFYEYVHLSKRISPQVLNYLCGILHLSSSADVQPFVVPPFKPQHKFLFLQKRFSGDISDLKLKVDELSTVSTKIDDEFRVRSTYAGLKLTELFFDLYQHHEASCLLFDPFKKYLNCLEVEKYPPLFVDLVNSLKIKIEDLSSRKLEKISVSLKKPKALRLYEPSVRPVYDTKRTKGVSTEKAEKDRLLHKIKRERKGAMREVRRDRAFIANIKFKKQQRSDAERMRKVKEIYSWGAQQQGEINALERLKKKKIKR